MRGKVIMMRINKYRKKSIVVVDAIQYKLDTLDDCLNFLKSGDVPYVLVPNKQGKSDMKIITLEGIMTVSYGDYIIRGVRGEFYPCKADIFEKTYERANNLKVIDVLMFVANGLVEQGARLNAMGYDYIFNAERECYINTSTNMPMIAGNSAKLNAPVFYFEFEEPREIEKMNLRMRRGWMNDETDRSVTKSGEW